MPVSGLRITAAGDRITVRENHALWEPATGQLVIDFSIAPAQGNVSFIFNEPPPAEVASPGDDPDALFEMAEELEASDPAAAEAIYRRLIALEPSDADAYLNLGFILCEAGRWEEASALYQAAVRHCPEDPLVHYNRAVALEAQGRVGPALKSYEESLRLQPDLVDAHQNAALLYAQAGQKQLAIRHFSAYRRLQPRT